MARKKELEKKEDSKPTTSLCWRCNKYKGQGDGFCNCWRPTDYDDKFCDYVEEYLSIEKDEYEKIVRQENNEKWYVMYDTKLVVKLPSDEWYYAYLNKKFNKSIVLSSWKLWKSKYKQFSDALEIIEIEQRKRLLNNGLSGAYNANIVKLVLSANHGMKETNTTELTWKDWWPLNVVSMSDEELLKLIQWK